MRAQLANIGKLILVAALGSAITLGIFSLSSSDKSSVRIDYMSGNPNWAKSTNWREENPRVPDFTEVAEQVTPSVVHIKSVTNGRMSSQSFPQPEIRDPFRDFFGGDDHIRRFFRFDQDPQNIQPQVGSGSGVIISDKGHIVTNNHVVANADEIEVTSHDNRTLKATLIGTDPSTDLALIQIEAEGLFPAKIANSDNVKVGQWALAVGNPFNLESTVTAGIVSAKARNINILKDQSAVESFIQTDAAVNPGNSGGALVDIDGNLIGINTAIASPTGSYAGYSFAVPSNMVMKVIEDLMRYGVVQRGFLGIMIRDLNSDLARENNLNLTQGVFVDSLMEDGAAKMAGIEKGDVIIKVAGIKVKSSPELQEIVARHRPGDQLEVVLHRDGKERTIEVTLKNKEGNTGTVSRSKNEVLAPLGAEFDEISSKEARRLGIPGGIKVTKLYPGKLRKQTNMREGFIITKVDGKSTGSIKELAKLIEEKGVGGVMLEGCYEDLPGKYYYAFGL